MGTLGNKGNVSIRFNYFDTSFAAVNCHLASDLDKNEARISELLEVLKINFKDSNKKVKSKLFQEIKLKEHDIQFIFGDLNFRIDLDNNTCRQWIASGNLKSLTGFDQFKKIINPSLMELEEGTLDFDPTYKYDIGTNNYDTSKKKRTPAWCDRILVKRSEDVEIVKYDKVNYVNSDHRPVYGIYQINVKKIIHEEKERIIRDLKENNDGNNRSKDISCNIYFMI